MCIADSAHGASQIGLKDKWKKKKTCCAFLPQWPVKPAVAAAYCLTFSVSPMIWSIHRA
jgi:hypothetical protein